MTKYEIKKVFSKTSSKIAVLLLLFVVGITCFFAMNVSYVDEKGDSKNGPAAVARLKAAQKEWSGYLDEEKIQKVIIENRRIRTSPQALSQNYQENDIAYSWGQGIMEIRNLLNCAYAEAFRSYDYYRADSLSPEAAGDFYDNRTKLLKEWLQEEAQYHYSDKEKEYLISQYETLETPFYYDYMAGWQQLFEFAPTIVMIAMLILGYLVAGIFSNEFTWKSDAVFFSSFYGRNKAVSAKVKAGFCIVTAIYFVTFLTYTGIVLLYLGTDGWNLAIQTSWTSWKSFYHVTNLQEYFLIIFGGYIGCLFISSLCMMVSAKTRSSVLAVMIPFILIFIPSFLANIDSALVNKIIGLLPDQLLQIGVALKLFNLYSIGGKVFGEVPVIIILYAILTVILLPVIYLEYRHKQMN